MSDPATQRVSTDEAKAHLARVLKSRTFSRADRQRRFLAFAVEKTLAGDRERLKESVIGHEVFDRAAAYDPKVDAIVRVEANRLRKKLNQYYLTEGRTEPVRLMMSAGSYLVQAEYSRMGTGSRRAGLKWIAAAAGVAIVAALAWALKYGAGEGSTLALTPARLTSFGGVALNPVLSRDGDSVLFSSDVDGGQSLSIWSQPIAGGTPRRLTPAGADAVEPDISPDGSTVVFHYRHPNFPGIYTVPVTGGEPKQLALLGSAPRFSPDGKFILFTIHNSKRVEFGRIFVVESHGGAPDQLVPEFADAHNAIWSEDGRHVLFCGTQVSGVKEKEHDWWILPFPARQGVDQAAKSGLLPEFASRHAGSPLAVPPNTEIERPGEWYGGRVLFASVTGGPPSLWSVEMSGTRIGSLARLTAGTSHHSGPRARRDRVVFTGGESDIGVWRIPLTKSSQAGKPERITSEAPNEIYPDLSPDGKWLAYVSDNFLDKSQPRQVRLRDLESGEDRVLRPSAAPQGGVAFSRDGTQIAFSEFGKPAVAIFTTSVKGGESKKACNDCGRVLDWSPDGRRILFEAGANVAFLAALDIASGRVDSLVTHPEDSVRSGRFSPDGRWVIFNAETGRETARVFVAPAGGVSPPRDWIPISAGNAMEAGPAFSPDGRMAYYASFGAANGAIFRLPFDSRTGRPTGPATAVYAFDSPRRGFSRITPWHIGMSLNRDKGIILSVEQQSSEIYLAELPR